MANLEHSPKLPYTLVPNTLPDSAGYHYAVSHIGSRSGDAIFKSVADKLPGQTAAGVELVWESLIAAVRESLMEHLYRVSMNGVAFELAIPGSTTSINGMPTEGAYVSITPSATLRSATAGMTPVYSAGEEDVPSVKRVENLAAHKNGEIVDAEVFRIAGNNITAAGDDESLKAVAADGADIIDLGGESTRPGATPLGWEEEWQRIEPVLRGLLPPLKGGTVPISVDTYHPGTAARAVEAGARIVNCVYADPIPEMLRICAKRGAELVIPSQFLGSLPIGS